jgi:hypothetical protein
MKQYGQQGLCLIWGVNNALGRKVLTKEGVFSLIHKENVRDKKRNSRYYVGWDGIDFKTFKKVILNGYGIYLKKVKNYKMTGSYLLTYDFNDYLHTVALRDGEVIDSRREKEIKDLDVDRRLVDVYKVVI